MLLKKVDAKSAFSIHEFTKKRNNLSGNKNLASRLPDHHEIGYRIKIPKQNCVQINRYFEALACNATLMKREQCEQQYVSIMIHILLLPFIMPLGKSQYHFL